ncbi:MULTISPECIES: DUF551 domain-containing protein [Yersinia]|uniref:DUF551 domain-containing protein n=1 Tax=Yersinia TaxID=629 RepID=UPI000EADC561|nr:DUF551 domain-containing protein [Yersinia sp. IP36721]
MKELNSFTVERLEGLIGDAETWSFVKIPSRELKALARIALAAKRTEPVYQYQSGICNDQFDGFDWVWDDCDKGFYEQYAADRRRIVYTTPQLNFPQGWIKCSDQMPENSNIQCFVYCKDSLRRTGYFDGDDWAINGKYYDESFVTHWQKFPAAPEKPL